MLSVCSVCEKEGRRRRRRESGAYEELMVFVYNGSGLQIYLNLKP